MHQIFVDWISYCSALTYFPIRIDVVLLQDSLCYLQFRHSFIPLNSFPCFLSFAGGWVGAEIGNTIERFDPEENSWDVVGSMAVPRYYFGCCEIQGEYC